LPESVIEREEMGASERRTFRSGVQKRCGFVGVLSGRSQIAKVPLFRKRTDAETDVLCGQARNSAEFHCICGRFMVG